MRILKYLEHHAGAVLVVFALLIAQAACDLALPAFTADIVDVGIQQAGVPDAVPVQMRAQTFERIREQLSAENAALFDESYDESNDGMFYLNDRGREARGELAFVLVHPMASFAQAQQAGTAQTDKGGAGAESPDGMGSASQIQAAGELAAVADNQLASVPSAEADEALLEQQAILAVRAEYEACGIDAHGLQFSYLLSVGVRMLAVTLAGALAAVAVSFVASRTGAQVGRELRGRLFRRVVSFSDAEIQRFSAASLITRGTNDVQLIQMVCIVMMRMVLFAPILAVGGIVMVVRTNTSMTWVIALAVIVVLCLVGTLMAAAMPKFKIMQTLIDRVNLVARELITGLPVIRAFNRQQHEERRFDAANRDLRDTQLFTNRVMAFMQPSMMLVMNGASVLIVWVGSGFVDAGAIQTGDLIAFITYSMVIIASFLMLSMIAILLPRAEVAAQRIDEVLACEPSIRDPENPQDELLPASGGAKVEFQNVSFAYEGSSKPVLSHVSFTALPGETTAIIGATGSGKSTVLRLIERSHDVTEGRVLVDGVDVRHLTQHALRAVMGYVPQQAFLFSGTIGSNVGYSDPDMDEERMWEAVRIAQAAGFVEMKEGQLNASVSQGGTDVSGGQRQRLAIARALASDSRVLLFDDSFSALDYATDAALRKALHESAGDRTVIIVAQRIATIRSADNIVVLDEGRVVGQGTHNDLMASCAEYREIALSQLSAVELEGGDAA